MDLPLDLGELDLDAAVEIVHRLKFANTELEKALELKDKEIKRIKEHAVSEGAVDTPCFCAEIMLLQHFHTRRVFAFAECRHGHERSAHLGTCQKGVSFLSPLDFVHLFTHHALE
jgi:hypothetical protein